MYSIFSELLQVYNLKAADIAKATGVSTGSLSDWKSGRSKPKREKMQKIADYFGVSIDFLSGDSTGTPCNECGYLYNPLIESDRKEHEIIHKKWESAIRKHGFCWTYQKAEDIRNKSISIIGNRNLTEEEIINTFEDCIKSEFSNSLRNSGYDENHLSFKDFFAKQLGNWDSKDAVSEEVYKKLVDKYGVVQDDQSQYNLNDEDLKRLRLIKINPDVKVLIDESADLNKKDIDFIIEMVRKLKK